MLMYIKRIVIVLAALCCITLRPALAQLPSSSKYENRLIFLAQIDADLLKRVIRYDNKYMYCSFGEGMKLHDPFGQSNFYFASLASSYQFHKYFKFGGSYYGMSVRASKTGIWRWSHRFNADLNFKYKTGNWQFSARERLQYTYKNYNPGEFGVRNALALRSKFQVKYKFTKRLSAYIFGELRNTLNSPDVDVVAGTLVKTGRPDIYLDKIKSCVCAEYKCTDQVTLCLYGLWDYERDREWDITDMGELWAGLDTESTPALGVRVKYLF